MAHTDDQINSIIDSAMKLHRERGNADLNDEARAEIHEWLRSDKNVAAGRSDAQVATAIANAMGRAQRFRSPGPSGPIASGAVKQALYVCDQGLDHKDPWA